MQRAMVRALVAPVAMLAAACSTAEPPEPPNHEVTFSKQIARLLQDHCQRCHRPDGIAPFPLMTYADAAPYADRISAAVSTGAMPEDVAMRQDTGCAEPDTFEGPRRLTADEIDLIDRWVVAGAPEGDPRDLPPSKVFEDRAGWQLGEPALVVQNGPAGFEVPPKLGRDVFRRFAIATSYSEDRFITGFEALPGTDSGTHLSRVVHHVTLFIDPGAKSLDQQNEYQANPTLPGPGFEGEFTYPVALVGMWFPGSAPLKFAPGHGMRVPKGACLVMEVHYAGDHDYTVVDQTVAGVHLASSVDVEIASSLVKNETIMIPAGSRDTTVEAVRTFDRPFTLHSLTPHMHQLGTTFRVAIEQPDQGPTCLADVEWEFEHQGTYRLKTPRSLPAGTVIRTTCLYDNSTSNPHQFNDPPQDIVFGKTADHEMCQLTISTSDNGAPPPPPSGKLVINEILADPPTDYDANGDGVYSYTDDEFVELINAGNGSLDLSSATLADAVGVRLTLPAGTVLAPGEVLVVFGGGTPAPIAGARVYASGAMQLNNGGDTLRVKAADGTLLGEVTWGSEGGLDQSLVRATEKDSAAAFVQHKTISALPASPGRRADGSTL